MPHRSSILTPFPAILQAMAIQRLRKTLSTLQEQLHAADAIDPSEREDILEAIAAITDSLNESAPAPESLAVADTSSESSVEKPLDRLEHLIEHFESDHPKLSAQLAALAAALHNIGF